MCNAKIYNIVTAEGSFKMQLNFFSIFAAVAALNEAQVPTAAVCSSTTAGHH